MGVCPRLPLSFLFFFFYCCCFLFIAKTATCISPLCVPSQSASGIDINIVWVIWNSISQVYCSGNFFFVPYLWTWMNKGNIPFKRRKGTKMTHIYLLPASPVSSVLVKMCKPPPKKSLVSQTALEGSHCDCENDWDLINYPPWLM